MELKYQTCCQYFINIYTKGKLYKALFVHLSIHSFTHILGIFIPFYFLQHQIRLLCVDEGFTLAATNKAVSLFFNFTTLTAESDYGIDIMFSFYHNFAQRCMWLPCQSHADGSCWIK